MNIALFGGTFDPIHSGHVRVAKAAARKFQLDQVLFVPCGHPPHKVSGRLTSFAHRYAMVALACESDSRFIPSLLESPKPDGRPHYSIDTARALKRRLGPKDRLFFLIGIDALLDLPNWRSYRSLLGLVDFIVANRPGFDERKIREVLPRDMTSPDHGPRMARGFESEAGMQVSGAGPLARGSIRLPKTTLYLLSGVHVPVASRDIRHEVAARRSIAGLVPPSVEEYIAKEGLYRT